MPRTTHTTEGLRALARVLFAVTIAAGALLSLSAVIAANSGGSRAAAAPAESTVTYSATETIPAPPSSNFAGSSGGDGWAVALSPQHVYNVFHHLTQLTVACHLQSNASTCGPDWPKTVVDGSGNNFSTSIGPGLYLNQGTGKLYVYAVRTSDFTAGVVCIDTTKPETATGAQLFCGFTPLSAVGDAPIGGNGSGVSAPAIVGTNFYSFNEVAGAGTGTENKLLCYNLASNTACPGQPFDLGYGSDPILGFTYPAPIGAVGHDVIAQVVGSTDLLACFDTTTNARCGGSWPVTVTGEAGSPFPMFNSTGAVIGTCLAITTDPCFNLSGGSVATPPHMTTAVGANYLYNGPAVIIGARVYLANANTNMVDCYDYATSNGCPHFPKLMTGLSLLYTVNPDPQRPTCIWVNSDNGAAQIQNFDAFTGGGCGQGPTRVLASSFVAPNNICIPANYTSLQVLVPSRANYSSGSVQFEDFDGNPIAGLPPENLDNSGSVNLAPLNLTTKSPLPQFLITLNGAGSPPEVEVKLTWTGALAPECTANGQTVVGGQGYRAAASDGGVFAFGQDAFYGSMGGQPLNGKIIGIATTPDGGGYLLAAVDGGVFAFGDATFEGSHGNAPLDAPIVGIAITPDGKGYWLVAADGGVFNYGDAGFYNSLGGQALSAPITGITATPDGKGYLLVGADGAVYKFGDATLHGSAVGQALGGPIVGITSTHSGNGYWLVGADGGVLAYGDAGFFGSMGGQALNAPVVAILPTPSGNGYWLIAADGGVFAFGDAQFLGSMALTPLNAPIDSLGS
jgi:hypothetical protein